MNDRENQVRISVVIPVYNVASYLDTCVKSVLSQTYKEIEVILVDDGSTDESGAMCDSYADDDFRVKVVHKENGGLSSARNVGIKHCVGDYIAFIDSDDFIRTDYIEKLYRALIQNDAQLAVCRAKKFFKEEECDGKVQKSFTRCLLSSDMQKQYLLGQLPMYAHGKLYKRELFNDLEFPIGRLYEDIPVKWKLTEVIERCAVVEDEMYFYRQRSDSIINTKFVHGRMDQLIFSEDIMNDLPNGSDLYNFSGVKCFFSAADNYSLVNKENINDWKYLEEAIHKYRKYPIVVKNSNRMLKILAIMAYINVYIVRLVGKLYKVSKTHA